tara:strand:- start:311 stop:664 length:354 start_codon:yes stop_codon:yes gene_type:complete
MLYDYECTYCEHVLEDVYQKVDDEPLLNCPSCLEDGLRRIITGGLGAFVKDSNTIGGIADKNASLNKSKIQEAAAKKKESQPQVKPDSPSYYGSATNREVMSMTPQQQKKYIMEDKK